MKLRLFVVLACTLLAVSACVIEPIGVRGPGFYHDGDRDHHDYGRRVWRD